MTHECDAHISSTNLMATNAGFAASCSYCLGMFSVHVPPSMHTRCGEPSLQAAHPLPGQQHRPSCGGGLGRVSCVNLLAAEFVEPFASTIVALSLFGSAHLNCRSTNDVYVVLRAQPVKNPERIFTVCLSTSSPARLAALFVEQNPHDASVHFQQLVR